MLDQSACIKTPPRTLPPLPPASLLGRLVRYCEAGGRGVEIPGAGHFPPPTSQPVAIFQNGGKQSEWRVVGLFTSGARSPLRGRTMPYPKRSGENGLTSRFCPTPKSILATTLAVIGPPVKPLPGKLATK
jgi:hypothetical protein